VTHGAILVFSALGVAGQVLAVLLLIAGLMRVFGLGADADLLRRTAEGYELWLVFVVSSIATGGSLFFSEIAHFVPCELCWYQRICMYPLTIVALLAALANDRHVVRYLLPLPLVGAGVSLYHLLVENGVVGQSSACLISAPGGCATKWIEEFGYVTIPVLAVTGFTLCFELLLLGALPPVRAATVEET
jgi:disulfide bond formation protein DsbB